MLKALAWLPALILILSVATGATGLPLSAPMIGCYPCDSGVRNYWQDANSPWAQQDAIELLREQGFEWMRFGVTVQNHPELDATADWAALPWKGDYWSCREVGHRAFAQAAAAGMRLYLFLFLSDTAAHAGQQKPPTAWQDADVRQTCRLLEEHCFETVAYLKASGLNIEVYEVGNEIERGICGFRPHERVPCPPAVDQLRDMAWMRDNIWTPEARMLKAAIGGVKRADPQGEIVLHAASRPSPEDLLVTAFFEAMVEFGVPFDYAGLSFYPWVGYPSAPPVDDWRGQLGRWVTDIAALDKPVIVCEYSYPHHPPVQEPGTVVRPVPGFPFTLQGQAKWLREFLDWCRADPSVVGSFYFYPDYAWRPDEPNSRTNGLFLWQDGHLVPVPALLQLGQPSGLPSR